jgi:hypothetical protein
MHDTVPQTLEELRMNLSLPQSRAILACGRAWVDERIGIVHCDGDRVAAALASVPKAVTELGTRTEWGSLDAMGRNMGV